MTVPWNHYRKCPTCYAETGEECLRSSGKTVASTVGAGQPIGRPHGARQLRKGYSRG